MTEQTIIEKFSAAVTGKGFFFVEVKVSAENDITIVVESSERTVTLDDCVELSRSFEEIFDRETEDYSLTVSSAGLDQPFKVEGQFRKAIGSKVEVAFKGGKKVVATLLDADAGSITLNYTAMETVDGKKKKTPVEHTDRFLFEQVNSVRPFIVFE